MGATAAGASRCLPPSELPVEGGFDLVAADVGQGMAVLVRTRGHVLLFDAGPQYSRESDAGQRAGLRDMAVAGGRSGRGFVRARDVAPLLARRGQWARQRQPDPRTGRRDEFSGRTVLSPECD
jgi:hypothetical protein